MQKIAITGCGGAGKSTFARYLGILLKIDVIHLDKLFWRTGWVPTPQSERQQNLEYFLAQDQWILEGDGDGSSRNLTYDLRFAAADTIIWLDLPRSLCLWRALKRYFQYRGKTRPDLPPGCQEYWRSQGFAEFLGRVWNFPTDDRVLLQQKIREHSHHKTIIQLQSPREIHTFLTKLEKQNYLQQLRAQANSYSTKVLPISPRQGQTLTATF